MSLRPLALLLLAPLACVARPLDGDTSATDATAGPTTASTATTGDTGTTASPPTSTSATSAPDPSTSAGTTTSVTDMGVQPGGPCDPWIDDCPEGQKCMASTDNGGGEWNGYKCVPIVPDPAGLYEPCNDIGSPFDGEDTCDAHLICWNVDPNTGLGYCIGMCTGSQLDPGCVDANASCILSDASLLIPCVPGCDPLLQDCNGNEACIASPISDTFLCVLDASGAAGQVFDPCEFANACDPGLLCLDVNLAAECDPMGFGCCLPFCDLSLPNDCPGQGQQCLPWYQQGQPPAGLENVGVCGLPQP